MSEADDQEWIEREMAEIGGIPLTSSKPDPGPRRETPYNTVAAANALKPILTAGLLARCQVLAVVCPKGHILLRVVRTTAGLVVTGKGPEEYVRVQSSGGEFEIDDPECGPDGAVVSWAYDQERTTRRSRIPICALLEAIANPWMIRFQCRCRAVAVTAGWLRDRIGEGRPRAVYTEHRT